VAAEQGRRVGGIEQAAWEAVGEAGGDGGGADPAAASPWAWIRSHRWRCGRRALARIAGRVQPTSREEDDGGRTGREEVRRLRGGTKGGREEKIGSGTKLMGNLSP
jgi:hypothetical protein